jgi:hypothetical protein
MSFWATLAAIWLSIYTCVLVLVVAAVLVGMLWLLGRARRSLRHPQVRRVTGMTRVVERRSREGVQRFLVRPISKIYGVASGVRRAAQVLVRGSARR